MKYLFSLECNNGGARWGKTGQYGHMIVEEDNLVDAECFVQQYTPGGWRYTFIGLTNKPVGLVSDDSIRVENKELKDENI